MFFAVSCFANYPIYNGRDFTMHSRVESFFFSPSRLLVLKSVIKKFFNLQKCFNLHAEITGFNELK